MVDTLFLQQDLLQLWHITYKSKGRRNISGWCLKTISQQFQLINMISPVSHSRRHTKFMRTQLNIRGISWFCLGPWKGGEGREREGGGRLWQQGTVSQDIDGWMAQVSDESLFVLLRKISRVFLRASNNLQYVNTVQLPVFALNLIWLETWGRRTKATYEIYNKRRLVICSPLWGAAGAAAALELPPFGQMRPQQKISCCFLRGTRPHVIPIYFARSGPLRDCKWRRRRHLVLIVDPTEPQKDHQISAIDVG